MKKLVMLSLFLALGVINSDPASAVGQGAPSDLEASRTRPLDRTGNDASAADLGYEIFESSGNAGMVLLVDRSSAAVACGILHQVCLTGFSGTTEYVVAFDTGTASAKTAASSGSLFGKFSPSSTSTPVCYPISLDARWNRGLALQNSTASGVSHWYYRKCN